MASDVGYENYHEASQDYDSTRVAFGSEVILGAFSYGTKRPLRDLNVLDAGCGTGNYTVALSELVGHVTGLELNKGMLGKAAEKTAALKNVNVIQGDITNLPFPDGHFDAICCNLVIHHLDAPGAEGHPMIKQFVEEAYRVLKPEGGTLVVNTISPEQCSSPWYFSLLTQARQILSKKMPEIPVLQGFFSEVGFTPGPRVVLTDALFKHEHWLDKEGPFKKEWRNTVSVFALATPEELDETLKQWRGKIDGGTADQFIKECEERRLRIGVTTSVIAYKR